MNRQQRRHPLDDTAIIARPRPEWSLNCIHGPGGCSPAWATSILAPPTGGTDVLITCCDSHAETFIPCECHPELAAWEWRTIGEGHLTTDREISEELGG